MTRLLFICSMNQRRSLTAEHHFTDRPGLDVRSAGTARRDERAVTLDLIAWANVICAMDRRHLDWIEDQFGEAALAGKATHNLQVPDQYRYMDDELVTLLEKKVASLNL